MKVPKRFSRRALLNGMTAAAGVGVLNAFFVNCSRYGVKLPDGNSQSLASDGTTPAPTPGTDPLPSPREPLPPLPPDQLPAAIRPAWFGNHAIGEWFPIPASVHAGSLAAPTDNPMDEFCSSTRRLAYSGIALKGTQIVLAATGGHNDYSGNEVTAIELGVDVPAWQQLSGATPDSQRVMNAAYYVDGLPSSRHAYNGTHFSTTRNRLILHRTRFMWGSGVSDNATNGFNLSTNKWEPAGTFSPGYSPDCRDAHDNVWATGNYFELYKWTATTDTWAKTATFPKQLGSGMAHDSRRDQLFQFSWGDGQGNATGVWAYVFNIEGTTQTPITIRDSVAFRQFQADTPAYATMIYEAVNDRFLFWDGLTGRLYQITPNATTTWDISIVAVTGTTPPVAAYTFGRMAYVPALRGCVVMPSGHQSLYFIRLS